MPFNQILNHVPNVPCGVERVQALGLPASYLGVPNVPCGVESGFD